MEQQELVTTEVVDPQVRAYVNSLVSALGGKSADENGRYVLGDEALACLRDLKRWLKFYDEKLSRLDVARVLAESDLVNGDLVEILAQWPEDATENRTKAKIALSCLELIVPLTWPIEKDPTSMTVNHHRHIPFLQLAQVRYKSGILTHQSHKILRQAIRVALPSIATPLRERTLRDEGIMKIVLYFLRNLVQIGVPKGLPLNGEEDSISRSATIEAFEREDVFHLLLAMASGMGVEFNEQDVVVLEIIYHLLKGIDVSQVYMNEEELSKAKTNELAGLLQKEKAMKKQYARNAPSRHNRFGTMIWVQQEEDRLSAVSGQASLVSGDKALQQIDAAKKWKRPRFKGHADADKADFEQSVKLTASAAKSLRGFINTLIDAGFNPLISHLRKAIEREVDRAQDHHSRQLFYVISWLLAAHRLRESQTSALPAENKLQDGAEQSSYEVIAATMTQEMFILMTRGLIRGFDQKEWTDLNATMRCFTQTLLTVQEMAASKLDYDQEIAENIQNRLFYEEATHELLGQILRSYKTQGFGFLDSCTELAHTFISMLERYSKENEDMHIRSRRRTKKKATANAQQSYGSDSEAEDQAEAARTSMERKFDFNKFANKFLNQSSVDTFVALSMFYHDLSVAQLKRAHRFFHRIAFKMEQPVMLFRVDIIKLFTKMTQGGEALDSTCPLFQNWHELVKQILRKLVRKLEERPELFVEMLFSKTSQSARFLQYGPNIATAEPKQPKVAAEWEVKGDRTREEQIGIVVSALVDRNQGPELNFVKSTLTQAVAERQSWEAAHAAELLEADLLKISAPSEEPVATEEEASKDDTTAAPTPEDIKIKPNSEDVSKALVRNGQLRLLLVLCQFTMPEDPAGVWIIPASLSAEDLNETLGWIKKYENEPVQLDDGADGLLKAEDLLRRKIKPKEKSTDPDALSSDDALTDEDLDLGEYAPGGPTAKPAFEKKKKKVDESGKKKQRRTLQSRAEKAREKEQRMKSTLFVHNSDDESDAEKDARFFERESELRNAIKRQTLASSGLAKAKKASKKKAAQPKMQDGDASSDTAMDNDNDAEDLAALLRSDSESDVGGSQDTEPTSESIVEHPTSSVVRKRNYSNFFDGDSSEDESTRQTSSSPIISPKPTVAANTGLPDAASQGSSPGRASKSPDWVSSADEAEGPVSSAPSGGNKRRRLIIDDDDDE